MAPLFRSLGLKLENSESVSQSDSIWAIRVVSSLFYLYTLCHLFDKRGLLLGKVTFCSGATAATCGVDSWGWVFCFVKGVLALFLLALQGFNLAVEIPVVLAQAGQFLENDLQLYQVLRVRSTHWDHHALYICMCVPMVS